MTAAVWRWGEDIHAAFLLPGIDRALLAGLGLSLTLAGRKLTLLRMAGDNMGNVRLPVSPVEQWFGYCHEKFDQCSQKQCKEGSSDNGKLGCVHLRGRTVVRQEGQHIGLPGLFHLLKPLCLKEGEKFILM